MKFFLITKHFAKKLKKKNDILHLVELNEMFNEYPEIKDVR
jgi:hypothetical protein